MNGMSEDRIILHNNVSDPVDFELLTASFSGLASQYRRTLEKLQIYRDETNVRLFVTKIRSGSIEAEIGVAAVAFLTTLQFMDYFIVFVEFTSRIRRMLDYLSGDGKRPRDLDKVDCYDVKSFIGAVRSSRKGSLAWRHAKFYQKTNERETLVEFSFDESALRTADHRIDEELELLNQREIPIFRILHKVEFKWYQANTDEARTAGIRSSDKGIIESISPRPVNVFFPPGAEILKRRMTLIEGNPFRKLFVVDVHVQFLNDQPKVYTILELHHVQDPDTRRQNDPPLLER